MYFVQADPYKTIELIYNKEDIDFTTEYYHNVEDFIERTSPSNKRYYQKQNQLKQLNKEVQNHRVLSVKVGRSEAEKKASTEDLKKAKQNLINFYNVLKKSKKEYFGDGYILAKNQPFPNHLLSSEEQLKQNRDQYFDYIDVQDTMLLYSNIPSKRVYNYIMMYRSYSLKPQQQDSSYMVCAKKIIDLSKTTSPTYDFMCRSMVSIFEQMSKVNILPKIKELYLAKHKKTSIVTELIDEYVAQAEKLKPGHIAPNFKQQDLIGNTFELHKLKAENTVLMFWASWCGHCRRTLPIVKILYDDQPTKKTQVVAISLDSKDEDWRNFVTQGQYDWINTSDLKSWTGEVTKEYMIHSTPTFFVLDKDKKIILKTKKTADLEPYFR